METYILDGKTPVRVGLREWMSYFERADRKVALDSVTTRKVSTVFLGLNHGLDSEYPLLFETMVFGGDHDGECWRCATWDEAEKQHADALKLVRASR